jgi:uncharacterized lipoprotein YajG
MRHATASRLVLPILVSCLVLAGCSKATPTTAELVTKGEAACASIPAREQSECVAWFLSGYEDTSTGSTSSLPTTDAQRTGYAAGNVAAS